MGADLQCRPVPMHLEYHKAVYSLALGVYLCMMTRPRFGSKKSRIQNVGESSCTNRPQVPMSVLHAGPLLFLIFNIAFRQSNSTRLFADDVRSADSNLQVLDKYMSGRISGK